MPIVCSIRNAPRLSIIVPCSCAQFSFWNSDSIMYNKTVELVQVIPIDLFSH